MATVNHIHVVLIKPSKYDDDGFVVRYVRGVLPSNTLAAMDSLTRSFADRWKTDKDIHITVELFDDIVDSIPYAKIARKNCHATKVVAALVGVQSNQFVRASDIAQRLANRGVKVVIGGFHVSGIFALFDEATPEIQELIDGGITVVEGEAENVWEDVLSDIAAGSARPVYRKTSLPDISDAPVPQMERKYMNKFAVRDMATIDCSRGCPFNCSFCTIINVQGKKMRCRSAENVLTVIREKYPAGTNQYFFTDDNFSRNPAWEEVFDGLIALRESGKYGRLSFMMQVDTRCHTIPGFIDKAARAGCSQIFIGMESINQKNLEAAGKHQNKASDYKTFIDAWHAVDVMTHVGYIIGFPFDTRESVRHDIDLLKNELKVDQASFFMLTPLPGSRDHYNMVNNGDRMDGDLNKFDSFHVVMDHPRMTAEDWFGAYQDSWASFYEYEHLKNVLARSVKRKYWGVFRNIMWYKNSLLEPRHPMVAGFIRRKPRTDIREGAPVMKRLPYLFMRVRELTGGFRRRIGLLFELQELWWLTRKPDDPKFKLIADFSTALGDARFRLSGIDLSGSYQKCRDEASIILQSLKNRISELAQRSTLRGRRKKRFVRLVEDMNTFVERIQSGYTIPSPAQMTAFLTQKIRQAEDYAIPYVARRRRITGFWLVTQERIRHRHIIRFTLSVPRIMITFFRDLRLSIRFAWHLARNNM